MHNLNNIIRFHHLGIAVKSFEKSVLYYNQLNYECSEVVIDKLQNVELIYCRSIYSPDVELIKPIDEKSPVFSFLKKCDVQIYHQCYQTTDLAKALEFLNKSNKLFCVSQPKPAVLFNNSKVSFYQIPMVGLIELLEVDEYV